jgi:molybdopterin-guanine dinucleotide biosynthesis protein A
VYHQPVNDVTAFVLAGGNSTRMGRDKALLRLSGETLLERARILAKSVTENVFLVGDPAKIGPSSEVVEDIYPGRGPLGGIHAALMQTQTDLNLILAVDTPFIEERFLDFLVSEARNGNQTVTVPRTGKYFHPLCAVYRREFVTPSERALIHGQNKIDTLFDSVRTKVIEEDELARMGFGPEMFRNLNTPAEWKIAQASLREHENAGQIHSKSKRIK